MIDIRFSGDQNTALEGQPDVEEQTSFEEAGPTDDARRLENRETDRHLCGRDTEGAERNGSGMRQI
jgi:hypothetical protein